jgi:hypothetical protein
MMRVAPSPRRDHEASRGFRLAAYGARRHVCYPQLGHGSQQQPIRKMAAALSLHGSKLMAKRSMCVLAPISDFWNTERMRSGAPYYDIETETYHMFYQV